ncbi:unnamed protein product, partial [Ixodes pacificus]
PEIFAKHRIHQGPTPRSTTVLPRKSGASIWDPCRHPLGTAFVSNGPSKSVRSVTVQSSLGTIRVAYKKDLKISLFFFSLLIRNLLKSLQSRK